MKSRYFNGFRRIWRQMPKEQKAMVWIWVACIAINLVSAWFMPKGSKAVGIMLAGMFVLCISTTFANRSSYRLGTMSGMILGRFTGFCTVHKLCMRVVTNYLCEMRRDGKLSQEDAEELMNRLLDISPSRFYIGFGRFGRSK